MAGIAGIARSHANSQVEKMLDILRHRGSLARKILAVDGATLGVNWNSSQAGYAAEVETSHTVRDDHGPGQFALVGMVDDKFTLMRDFPGLAPLYYGRSNDNTLCFASEVKALLPITRKIWVLSPGYCWRDDRAEPFSCPEVQSPLDEPPAAVAAELNERLTKAVQACITQNEMGAWLSGGLDSSTLTALARPCVMKLHTFSSGLSGSPDLEHARQVARKLHTKHHEMIFTLAQLLQVLPDVIYHLESFDALLVRSSLANYLVARLASDYVGEVFSGEGGDEIFAGYDYLKGILSSHLAEELTVLTGALHNTALQRVDRCAAAHGIIAYLPFLDASIMEFANRIPVDYKLHNGIEKWILRQAVKKVLPPQIAARPKVKFWQGSGVSELLSLHANSRIPDHEFAKERQLKNGWVLNSKEELMYYRIFHDHFGDLEDLGWMGRTAQH